MQQQRLFVAFPIIANEELNELLYSLKRKLSHERLNWVKPENMHLTMKFIGETPASMVPPIIDVLEKITKKQSKFKLDFNRTGIFGSSYKPKVLWLGCNEYSEPLQELAKETIQQFKTLGFPADRQNFVPHLTLARINYLVDKALFQNIVQQIPQKTYLNPEIGSVILYESILRKEGPVYKIIREFQLTKR